ncbi:MAG: TetR family transcriptional regulator [Acidimicrobiales bacterium]|nr:TetR family transcriptional regulator [Acidimicrobiales bacterium]
MGCCIVQAMSSNEAPTKRRYNSSRRAMQAAQTRVDILDAAIASFRETGWAGTTLAALADRAGVAVETLYSTFGSKKALLRAALDVSVVGDAEDVPLVEREDFAQLGVGTLEERLHKGLTLAIGIHERSAGVWQAMLEASASDVEIEGWRREADAGRRIDLGKSFERILDRKVKGEELQILWVLFSPEAYLRLTQDAGLSRKAYESTIRTATLRILGITL